MLTGTRVPGTRIYYPNPVGLPTVDLGIPGLPPLPYPPSLLSPSHPSRLLPFPGVPPPKPVRGSGEHCKLPSGVWGEAPADKRSGAYLSQKEQLWWQQFLCIFIRINLNFCTNTKLLSSRYSVSLRAKHSVESRGKAVGHGVSRGMKSPEADHADDILQFNAQIC